MKSDRIADELEKIRDQLYREQPETMGTINSLIGLLQYVFCPHEWEHKKNPSTPDEPGEWFTICKKCGCERMED